MSLKIFVSWSGERSGKLAEALTHWLPHVIQASHPWMSKDSIAKGTAWFSEIGENLSRHNFGIVCVTPENLDAPWLLFESGALAKAIQKSRVCPLLLGMVPTDLKGPLSQFEATTVEKSDLFRLVKSITGLLAEDERVDTQILKDTFDEYWPKFEQKIASIARMHLHGEDDVVKSILVAMSNNALPKPTMTQQVFFDYGYESHSLYTAVTSVAKKRIYLFGRKNRKLFDKDHNDFIRHLPKMMKSGFDFRVLFLDPHAPTYILASAHKNKDFAQQLTECVSVAKRTLTSAGIRPSMCCRYYSFHRTTSMMVVDNAVLCSPIKTDKQGRALRLTKAPFSIIEAKSSCGSRLLETFQLCWNNARPFEDK